MEIYNRIVWHPHYGYGRVIIANSDYKILCRNLVYYFKPNCSLHDGIGGHCEDHHGWWYTREQIEQLLIETPLRSLIERRKVCIP